MAAQLHDCYLQRVAPWQILTKFVQQRAEEYTEVDLDFVVDFGKRFFVHLDATAMNRLFLYLSVVA